MTEEWCPVAGYNGKYEVSDQGRVRSHNLTKPFIRVPFIDRYGYHVYDLWSGGARRKVRVHILVAEAFIGPRPEGHDIRHLDGDPGHNAVENLAYGTRRENMLDVLAHGRNRQANQTHCKNGHEFTPENTYRFGPDGRHRDCKTCRDARGSAHYQRNRATILEKVPCDVCGRQMARNGVARHKRVLHKEAS